MVLQCNYGDKLSDYIFDKICFTKLGTVEFVYVSHPVVCVHCKSCLKFVGQQLSASLSGSELLRT